MNASKENYRLYECVGRGGFGEVYRARSLLTGQESAIKLMEKRAMKSKGMLERVLREVEIHSRLKHPFILELYGYFEDSNYIYMDLEYCPKGDLQTLLKKRNSPFSEDEVRILMRQIVEGTRYLHSHKIVHRDLKLPNILLSKNNQLKIADFGLAIQLKDESEEHNTLCGTLNYISPEVLERSPHGLEVDLWSIGCMLFNLLTGKPPFGATQVKGTVKRVRENNLKIPPSISFNARNLLHLILQKDPKMRINIESILLHPFFQQNSPNEKYIDSNTNKPVVSSKASIENIAFKPLLKFSHDNPNVEIEACETFSLESLNRSLRSSIPLHDFSSPETNSKKLSIFNVNSSEEDKGFTSSTSACMQAFNHHPKSSEDNFSDLESSFSSKNIEVFSSNTTPLKQPNHDGCFVQQTLAKPPNNLSNLLIENEDDINYTENIDSSLGSHSHSETQNNISLFKKSKSFENMGRILNVFDESSQKSNKNACANFQNSKEEMKLLENFTTARLTPIEHKTKSAMLTILEDGSVCSEFFRKVDNLDKVYKILKIDPEKKVHLFEPKIFLKLGSLQSSNIEKGLSYELWNVPNKWQNKLKYVCQFVNLVRSKTPKITIYTSRAKCMLMENLPLPDLQVDFLTGYKFTVTEKQVIIKNIDNSYITITFPSKAINLSSKFLEMWNYVCEMQGTCKLLENLTLSSSFAFFPITLGRKSLYSSYVSSANSSNHISSEKSRVSIDKVSRSRSTFLHNSTSRQTFEENSNLSKEFLENLKKNEKAKLFDKSKQISLSIPSSNSDLHL